MNMIEGLKEGMYESLKEIHENTNSGRKLKKKKNQDLKVKVESINKLKHREIWIQKMQALEQEPQKQASLTGYKKMKENLRH